MLWLSCARASTITFLVAGLSLPCRAFSRASRWRRCCASVRMIYRAHNSIMSVAVLLLPANTITDSRQPSSSLCRLLHAHLSQPVSHLYYMSCDRPTPRLGPVSALLCAVHTTGMCQSDCIILARRRLRLDGNGRRNVDMLAGPVTATQQPTSFGRRRRRRRCRRVMPSTILLSNWME